MTIKKIAKDSLVLSRIPDGLWAGSNIAEVLPATGDTKMSCGIHELFASESVPDQLARCFAEPVLSEAEGFGMTPGPSSTAWWQGGPPRHE